MKLIDALKSVATNAALTENGATTNASTTNPVLNLFFQAGASRSANETRINTLVAYAAKENLEQTAKVLFWSRDVLQGAGERRFFRVGFQYLLAKYPDEMLPLLKYIPTYGRWDDLLTFLYEEGVLRNRVEELTAYSVNLEIYRIIAKALYQDKDGLCAKWMPREKSSKSKMAAQIRKGIDLDHPSSYRQLLVSLSKTVEQQMCANKWDEVLYPTVPSKASQIYRKAFTKHDKKRYDAYRTKLIKGETKINAKALFPHDVVKAVLASTDSLEKGMFDVQWKSLPDFMEGNTETILPLCDTSGSMSTEVSKGLSALNVCVSLGLYIAERNKGEFHNHFITFQSTPTLQEIKGRDLYERVLNLSKAEWGTSTNLVAAFELILNTAKRVKLDQKDMPSVLLVLSDMEFNYVGITQTNFDTIKELYANSGYVMPTLVFWNLAGRNDNYPVKQHESGTALVSGFSPSLLKSLFSGKVISPYESMRTVIGGERYEQIAIG